jgi:hypothetical protein
MAEPQLAPSIRGVQAGEAGHTVREVLTNPVPSARSALDVQLGRLVLMDSSRRERVPASRDDHRGVAGPGTGCEQRGHSPNVCHARRMQREWSMLNPEANYCRGRYDGVECPGWGAVNPACYTEQMIDRGGAGRISVNVSH